MRRFGHLSVVGSYTYSIWIAETVVNTYFSFLHTYLRYLTTILTFLRLTDGNMISLVIGTTALRRPQGIVFRRRFTKAIAAVPY